MGALVSRDPRMVGKRRPLLRAQANLVFPDPATLAAYKQVDLKLLNAIIGLVKKEQRHRHNRENGPARTQRMGVLCGLLIGVAGLVAACYIAAIGSPIPGMALVPRHR